MRSKERDKAGLRPLSFELNFVKHPEGSCLVKMGDTWVLCSATIEEKVPPFLDGKGQGWVTAEYAMLPRATNTRTRRESHAGKPTGRSQEIQRLIGRALRAAVDLKALGERTIVIDCDVLQADGGTRVASINGGFLALALAIQKLQKRGKISGSPIKSPVAAVSIGLKENDILVDPDYAEDMACDVDLNVVQLEKGQIVELQGTAEKATFSLAQSQELLQRSTEAIATIIEKQYATIQSVSA